MSHEHGTWRGYQYDACRCPQCRRAYKRYRAELAGTDYHVEAAPAREHLEHLVASGVSMRMIAEKLPLSHGHLKRLRSGETTTARSATVETILAITPEMFDEPAPSTRVSSTGAARRLRALAAIGWSLSAIVEATQVATHGHLSHIRSGKRTSIMPETDRAISQTYEQLRHLKPVGLKRWAESTRRTAERAGWCLPSAYRDDELDLAWGEPECERRVATVRRATMRTVSAAEFVAVRSHLIDVLDSGVSVQQVADHLGVPRASVHALRSNKRVDDIRPDDIRALDPRILREHERGRVPAHGVARRLRALAAIGWSAKAIAEATKIASELHLAQLRSGATDRVSIETEREIRRAYERLWNRAPEPSRRLEAVKRDARRHGWHPPMDYDDHELDLTWGEAACERDQAVTRTDVPA